MREELSRNNPRSITTLCENAQSLDADPRSDPHAWKWLREWTECCIARVRKYVNTMLPPMFVRARIWTNIRRCIVQIAIYEIKFHGLWYPVVSSLLNLAGRWTLFPFPLFILDQDWSVLHRSRSLIIGRIECRQIDFNLFAHRSIIYFVE